MATEFETVMQGVQVRRLSTNFKHLRIHYVADPLKRGQWNQRTSIFYGGMDSSRWRREMEIDYKAYGGERIWPMLSEYHAKCFDVSKCTIYRIIDQGIRHPTVCIWVALNARGDRHIYREYYATDRSIAMNCRMILDLSRGEDITGTFIDPSCRKRTHENLTSIISVFEKNGIFCLPADNSFAGYDAVGSALLSHLARISLDSGQLHGYLQRLEPIADELVTLASKPALTFDLSKVQRVYDECRNLRWKDTKGDETQIGTKEKPVDVDDDGPDVVRYAIMTAGLVYTKSFSTNIVIDARKILASTKVRRSNGYGRRSYRPRALNV